MEVPGGTQVCLGTSPLVLPGEPPRLRTEHLFTVAVRLCDDFMYPSIAPFDYFGLLAAVIDLTVRWSFDAACGNPVALGGS